MKNSYPEIYCNFKFKVFLGKSPEFLLPQTILIPKIDKDRNRILQIMSPSIAEFSENVRILLFFARRETGCYRTLWCLLRSPYQET